MSDDGDKKVYPNHDRAVRALALGHAVELARSGIGVSMRAEAIVAVAETFRAFLTVPGTRGDHVIMSGDRVRGTLSPSSTVVLPATVTMPPAPASDALAVELREWRRVVTEWIAEERQTGNGDRGV